MTRYSQHTNSHIGLRCREWLKDFIPPLIALPSVDDFLHGWKRHREYIVAGHHAAGVASIVRTLVQPFAATQGQIIWIGTNASLRAACERMVFTEAGIPIPFDGILKFDMVYQDLVNAAHEECCKWQIQLLNIDECGDVQAEQKFFNELSHNKPTLIVVEPDVFEDVDADAFRILTRRVHLGRMIEQLKCAIPDWRILWNLPLKDPANTKFDEPVLADIAEDEILSRAHAVLFACPLRYSWRSSNANLIVAKNNSGRTGTIELQYAPAFSRWSESTPVA
jgi:replicative DNA helicase